MVMIGDQIKIPYDIPSAGEIDTDDWVSEKTGEVSMRATLQCPHCRANQMPLCKKNTEFKGTTYPWSGCDHQDVRQYYVTKCTKCKKPYQFGVFFAQ